MVDMKQPLNVQDDWTFGGNRLQLGRQFGKCQECGRAMQCQFMRVIPPVLIHAQPQTARMGQQLKQRQTNTHQHARQQIHRDHHDQRNRPHHGGQRAITVKQVLHMVQADQSNAGHNQDACQRRHRNLTQQPGQQRDEAKYPDAVQDSGHAGLGASLDVGGTADDNAGHGQSARNAAQQIAYALRAQFAIIVGPHTIMHPVHRSGRQQCFSAGDEGDRDGSRDDRRVHQLLEQTLARQRHRCDDRFRHYDAGHRQAEQKCH